MSEVDKRVELAEQLVRVTKGGRVAWQPTAKLDEFVCSLEGRYTILVDKNVEGICALRMLDEDERELLRIAEDDSVLRGPTPPQPGLVMGRVSGRFLLLELFDLARRSALHVDQAIEEALQGLKRA